MLALLVEQLVLVVVVAACPHRTVCEIRELGTRKVMVGNGGGGPQHAAGRGGGGGEGTVHRGYGGGGGSVGEGSCGREGATSLSDRSRRRLEGDPVPAGHHVPEGMLLQALMLVLAVIAALLQQELARGMGGNGRQGGGCGSCVRRNVERRCRWRHARRLLLSEGGPS